MARDEGAAATDAIDRFFTDLDARGREPLLRRTTGVLRFDVDSEGQVEHWLVRIDEGDVDVARSDADADAVLSTDETTLAGLLTGRLNALSAVLRGAVSVEGELGLVMLFQRLLPAPPAPASGDAGPTPRDVA